MKKKVSFFLCAIMAVILCVNSYVMAGLTDGVCEQVPNIIKPYTAITSITDFTKYSTDYGYNSLASRIKGTNEQALYNELLEISKQFWNSTSNITETGSDGKYIIAKIDISSYGLNSSEVAETYVTFKNDNPLFYFASNSIEISGTYMYYCTEGAYKNASARNECKTDIINGLNEFGKLINGKTSQCDIIMTIYDKINSKIYYAYDSNNNPSTEAWAHNIMGYFDDDIAKGVCECYARTLQLALNMAGIENYFVSGSALGEEHAWNLAKFDDGKYYYLDATWDDTNGGYNYFAKGNSFDSDHTVNNTNNEGIYYLYDLPEVGSSNFKITVPSNITSVADFMKIALNPSGTYTLATDIDFSKEKSCNDGTAYIDIDFSGTLNGGGYTIKGLKTGLFKSINKNGTVKNLKLNADFSGSVWNNATEITPQYKYALAEKNYGTISKCELEYKINNGSGRALQTIFVSGMADYNYGTIENCKATMNICDFVTGNTFFLFASGITRENYGKITKCNAVISAKNNGKATKIEISGMAQYNRTNGVIDGCTADGSVKCVTNGTLTFSGIVENNGFGTVKNCINNTDVTTSTGELLYMAGIASVNSSVIENCTNTGDLYNKYGTGMEGMASGVGGICAWNASNDICKGVVKGCTNSGTITTEKGQAAGIASNVWEGSEIIDCTNTGNINGISDKYMIMSGGVIGAVELNIYQEIDGQMTVVSKGKVVISGCKNSGKVLVTGKIFSYAGCVIGDITILNKEAKVTIKNCENSGTSGYKTATEKNRYANAYISSGEENQIVMTGCKADTGSSGGNVQNTTTVKKPTATSSNKNTTTIEENTENNTTDDGTTGEDITSDSNTESTSVEPSGEENTDNTVENTDNKGTGSENDNNDDGEKSSDKKGGSPVVPILIVIGVLAAGGAGAAGYVIIAKKKK